MKQPPHHPRAIVACKEAPLGRIILHTLTSLGAEAVWVPSHNHLTRRLLHDDYDIILTRFVAPLLESRHIVRLLCGRHIGTPRTLYVLADNLTPQESIALLERGVTQLLSLPISITRLERKLALEVNKSTSQCRRV